MSKKAFGKLGYTVVILGLLSFMFIGDASDELVAATLVGVALCAITGIWLVVRPSIGVGVAAGASLVVLGIIDLLLATEGPAGFGLMAPVIDFGFAVRVFIGCASYAKTL